MCLLKACSLHVQYIISILWQYKRINITHCTYITVQKFAIKSQIILVIVLIPNFRTVAYNLKIRIFEVKYTSLCNVSASEGLMTWHTFRWNSFGVQYSLFFILYKCDTVDMMNFYFYPTSSIIVIIYRCFAATTYLLKKISLI